MYGPINSARDDGSLAWLYLDMNSYFASVEQQLTPHLRGKPVAVLPLLAETTSAIAASYEAKAFGIKTGTMVCDARRLCPDIQFVVADHGRYVEFHHKILKSIETVLPIDAVCSIDEYAIRLMGKEKTFARACQLAAEIKSAIYHGAGEHIHASIGLAPSRYLAKVAADMKKPNGLTAIFKHELPNALLPLKLRDLPGVGEKMEARLNNSGVFTMKDLIALDPKKIHSIWGGIWGTRMSLWIRGQEVDLAPTKRSSISHSHMLAPELRNTESARLVALKLLHKAAARLRRENFWARRLSLHVRFLGYAPSTDRQMNIPECCDDLSLVEFFKRLWDDVPRQFAPRQVAIVLSDLIQGDQHTLPLFHNPRHEQLSRALDQIQDRFGKRTLYFAGLEKINGVAQPKIAFTNIPDVEAEEDGFAEKK